MEDKERILHVLDIVETYMYGGVEEEEEEDGEDKIRYIYIIMYLSNMYIRV